MSIETDSFRRMEPVVERLEPYGFTPSGDTYVFTTEFQDGAFRAEVTVTEEDVSGKVIDTDTGEEYMPMRSPTAIGAFVGQVREDYAAILGDIAEHCFRPLPFATDQANRVARYVRRTFGDEVEYTFPKYPDNGVFRDGPSRKWYGIIMPVSKARLERLSAEKFAKDRGEKLPPEPKAKKSASPKDMDAHPEDEIEVLNVKLDPVKIPLLEQADGFYPCYHMNRSHWITVALDERVSDAYLMELLQESHALSIAKPKGKSSRRIAGEPLAWFVPANPRYFDIEAAFRAQDEISWKQGGKFEPGDIAYMYVGAPVSAIRYKCLVTATDCGTYTNHKGRTCTFMMIRKLKEYDPSRYPWSKIKETGLGTAQGTKYIPPKLKALLEETETHEV